MLLVKTWEFESRIASIAVVLGDGLVCDMPSMRLKGTLVSLNATVREMEVEEFKGDSGVCYSDDGERHVFIAGEPLGSGENAARFMASNASVVEIHASAPAVPSVFTTQKNAHFHFSYLEVEKKVELLRDIPQYRESLSKQNAGAHSMAMSLVPDFLKSKVRHSGQDPYGSLRLETGAWIPFNRIGTKREWQKCMGAIRWLTNVQPQAELVTSIESSILKSGLLLGSAATDGNSVDILGVIR